MSWFDKKPLPSPSKPTQKFFTYQLSPGAVIPDDSVDSLPTWQPSTAIPDSEGNVWTNVGAVTLENVPPYNVNGESQLFFDKEMISALTMPPYPNFAMPPKYEKKLLCQQCFTPCILPQAQGQNYWEWRCLACNTNNVAMIASDEENKKLNAMTQAVQESALYGWSQYKLVMPKEQAEAIWPESFIQRSSPGSPPWLVKKTSIITSHTAQIYREDWLRDRFAERRAEEVRKLAEQEERQEQYERSV
jgi:hypothetical protein